MPSRRWRLRSVLVAVLLASAFAWLPGTAGATYTGLQSGSTVGTLAAGGGWIAVPEYQYSYDPGEIDGTPSASSTNSLEVARVRGGRRISFRSVQPSSAQDMGPMQVSGAGEVIAAVWADYTGAGVISTATLNARGNLPAPVSHTGAATAGSVHLSSGPDGAYALIWTDAAGVHAIAAPAGLPPAPLVGPGIALEPADRVVLSGGDSFWLVKTNAGLSVAPAVFGQGTTPSPITIGDARQVSTLGDNAGGLWALARDEGGWFVAHFGSEGGASMRLPGGAQHPVIALAGSTALVAFRAGPRCRVYVERLRANATVLERTDRTNIAPRAGGCSSPTGIAVDPNSTRAYVLLRGRNGTTLTTEMAGGHTSSWRGALREHVDAIVAAGSNHVAIESNRPQRNLGEQCGGANPSFSQQYNVRIFRGIRLQRSGRLQASTYSC
jgi:hypothetical protein